MNLECHKRAMAYRNEVLGLRSEETPNSAITTAGLDEPLDPSESHFLARSLERLISSGGDRLDKEYVLADQDSGDRYLVTFSIKKV